MKKRGFTLVEIIVVLIIVAILAAALIPTMSGIKQRAEDAKMINETRALLSSAQYLLSEHYVKDGDTGENSYVIDYEEAASLADVPGKLTAMSYRGIMDVTHLEYSRDGRYCLYCRDTSAGNDCPVCHAETAYTVSREATVYLPKLASSAVLSVFTAAGSDAMKKYFPKVGSTISSVDFAAGTPEGEAFYSTISASDRAFLNNTTWKVMNTRLGLRLYFVLDNYGTGTSEAVRVYKYEPGRGYQYNDKHRVTNGVIDLSYGDNGDSEWYYDGVKNTWGSEIQLP